MLNLCKILTTIVPAVNEKMTGANRPGRVRKTYYYQRFILRMCERRMVYVNDKEVILTLKEFDVLKYMLENKGIVLTRDQLLTHIWGYDFDGETRTVDVHIRTLRSKLGNGGAEIETVRGMGYRIGGRE